MPLDKDTLEGIKKQLETQKTKLTESLSQISVQSKENPSDYNAVFPDYGTEEEDSALEVATFDHNLAMERNLEKELKEVNWALERIEKGEYGKCSQCEKEIEPERLKARPIATKCTECTK